MNGFCPSFVTIEGGQLKKPEKVGGVDFGDILSPTIPVLTGAYNIIATGIGGTGVLTVGQVLGMAAFLEGKGLTVLDLSGLAQKNGSVLSHIRIAPTQDALSATRVAAGEANLVLGCDILTTSSDDSLAKMQVGVTRAVINTSIVMPAQFTTQADLKFPLGSMERDIAEACGENAVSFLDASKVATALMGDSIATNLFVLGYAWQKGWVPLLEATLMRAIELNGAAVDMNKAAFLWGRRAAVDLKRVQLIGAPKVTAPLSMKISESLEEIIARRVQILTDYQNAAYAKTYSDFVAKVAQLESAKCPGKTALTEAVARYYFKLLAVKDEYEVARLHSNGDFEARIYAQFEGDYTLHFHLAPPRFAKRDAVTGELQKREYGPWMMKAFRFLAARKGLRGTVFDVFGRSEERRMESALKVDYRRSIENILTKLAPSNHALAVQIAQIPEDIRGFGHVKERHVKVAKAKEAELIAAFENAKLTIDIVQNDAKVA